jgi:hypothetical protein
MRLPLIALAALAALVAAQEPAKVQIAWTLKKGEKVRYEFNHRLETREKDHTELIELTLGVGLEATDPGADRTNGYKLTFERIALSKSGDFDYDTARDKEPPENSYPRVMSKCAGKTIPIRIGPTGKLLALDEIRKTVQDAVDAFPDLKGRSRWNAEGVDATAKKMEWLLRLGFETARGGPAAVGDTWETTYDFNEVMKTGGTATCKAQLKEVRAGVASVDQALEFKYPDALGALVKGAKGRGSLTWDIERGVLKSLGATSEIRLIKSDVVHTVTVGLLPDAPAK